MAMKISGSKSAIRFQDSTVDAFNRLRVSNVQTLFDSKQLNDNQPFFWDDSEVSGSGTTSTYNANQASTTLAVGDMTAGERVRQTFQRFNYQPGKSQMVTMTTNLSAGGAGITAQVGYFDDKNGLFFESKDGVMSVVCRSYTSGSAVDTKAIQANWNLDKMDGTGPSGITADPTKNQILFMDFEWLGVGRIRFGFFNKGKPVYCHEFKNANNSSLVYMSTPNLPLRYGIANDGTGGVSSIKHLCSSVASEGGSTSIGILRHFDSDAIASLSNTGVYGLLGIRLKSTHIDIGVILETISLLATTTNDQVHWSLVWNPTVAGTFTYADITNSAVQVATGDATNTITGGTEIDGGYFTTSQALRHNIDNALKLGSSISGTQDTIVLLVRPITNNITIQASLTWRELS